MFPVKNTSQCFKTLAETPLLPWKHHNKAKISERKKMLLKLNCYIKIWNPRQVFLLNRSAKERAQCWRNNKKLTVWASLRIVNVNWQYEGITIWNLLKTNTCFMYLARSMCGITRKSLQIKAFLKSGEKAKYRAA